MESVLRVASEQITSEILDGEVMIVNLETGSYYSMTGPGTEIWQCLQLGSAPEQILGVLSENYSVSAEQIEASLKKILDQLLEEKLIKDSEHPQGSADLDQVRHGATNKIFSEPTLNKYTDMQELLLLDPIHDVDEAGWPLAKDNSDN